MPSNTTWGLSFGFVGMMTICPLALVKGTLNAINGESFDRGFCDTVGKAYDFGYNLGEKHGQLIEKTLVKAAVWTSVSGIGDGINDEFSDGDPRKGPGA